MGLLHSHLWVIKLSLFAALPELSEEEKKQILMSEKFQKFFDYSSRIIERALAEEVDIFVDYAGKDSAGKDEWVCFLVGVGGGMGVVDSLICAGCLWSCTFIPPSQKLHFCPSISKITLLSALWSYTFSAPL